MSRRISACLQEAVVCDDELIMEDPLLDEDKLEETEDGIVAVGEGLDEAADTPWSSPVAAPREVTLEELDATRMYLSEIGFSPLLTAQEEVYFARRVIQGDAAARNLHAALSRQLRPRQRQSGGQPRRQRRMELDP